MRCRISRIALDRCVAEAGASGGSEICGLLVGGPGWIEDAIAVANAAVDPASAFLLQPDAHLRASRELRGSARRIVGHYHSHPAGPARPSSADAAQAHEQGLYWLIVTPAEQRLWISRRGGPERDAFAEVEMEVGHAGLPCNVAPHGPIEAGHPGAPQATNT